MSRVLFALLAGSAGIVTAAASPAPSVEGLWMTDDGKALVRIAPCGAQLCGRIAQVTDPDPKVPKTDVNNPDPRRRGRPILGLTILSGFTRSGAVWKGGRAYDPKSGKSYMSSLQLDRDGRLKVTGCVLLFCDSRHWTRAR